MHLSEEGEIVLANNFIAILSSSWLVLHLHTSSEEILPMVDGTFSHKSNNNYTQVKALRAYHPKCLMLGHLYVNSLAGSVDYLCSLMPKYLGVLVITEAKAAKKALLTRSKLVWWKYLSLHKR